MNIKKLINDNKWNKIYTLIIDSKIDIYTEISNGNTIAHLAAINNNNKIIKYLLTNNKDILEKSNNEGNSAIFLLGLYGYIDLLKECIKKYPEFLELLNNNNETILCILYNDINFIKWICKHITKISCNNNILIKNINESEKINDTNYNILKLLFEKYGICNTENEQDSILCYSIKKNKSYIANLLIEYNYDINKQDSKYITPFIYAVKNRDYDLVNLLISKGCDINYTGGEGDYNPMIWSIINNDVKLIDILLENNFDVNKYNRYIETSLHYALYNKTLDKQLSPTIISKMLYYGNLNIKNINGQTPLHLLCKYHNWKNYNYIMQHKKLDIFIEDNHNKRPFDYLNGNYIYDFIDTVVSSYTKLLEGNINYIEQCKTDTQSSSCKAELKKHIFNTKRSIPIGEDNMVITQKIKMITGEQSLYGLFNSDTFHNIIYTVLLLKKYKNVGIPFQYYFNDKYINDQMIIETNNLYKQSVEFVITDLVKIYSEYFYKILPYLIIWRSSNQYYIHPNLKFLLKKCLLSPKIRFIVLKLTLVTSPNGTHANIIIYDKIKNTLERFEPYGVIPYLESNNLNKLIEELGRRYINVDLKYYTPNDIFGTIGFQTISNDSNISVKQLGNPVGFCLSWTLWYLEMRINNPDVEPNTMLKHVMDEVINNKVVDSEKLFVNFIKNYASDLDKQKNNFLLTAGVSNANIYNLVLHQDDQNKVISLLETEFNRIVNERY